MPAQEKEMSILAPPDLTGNNAMKVLKESTGNRQAAARTRKSFPTQHLTDVENYARFQTQIMIIKRV
jgi:hypothetical protein